MGKDITYLGSFDDRIESYLDYGKLDIKTLNEILISEMFFSTNSKIVINDGYIVNSPILKAALLSSKETNSKENYYYYNSPLFSLIKNDFVSVLSRENSLVDMVDKMAKQGNQSFIEITKNELWESRLSKLDFDLNESFIKWPKYNISHGFHILLSELLKNSPKDLNLKINEDEFKKIKDEYNNQIVKSLESPRNQWELIVQNSQFKNELMNLASIVYHYNFGLCLQSDTYANDNVYINTLNNSLFENKQSQPIETDVDLTKLNFSIPTKISINDKLISELKTKGELNDIHNEFVSTNLKYIKKKASEIELKRIQDEFKKKIIDFDIKNSKKQTNQILKTSVIISCAAIATGLGFGIPGIAAAVVTTVGGGVVGELVNGSIDLARTRLKYSGDKYSLQIKRQLARFSSYEISKEKSKEHTDSVILIH
ncbi:MAG: hypothetical protein ABIN67_00940 [Ferruginibacter sp.]